MHENGLKKGSLRDYQVRIRIFSFSMIKPPHLLVVLKTPINTETLLQLDYDTANLFVNLLGEHLTGRITKNAETETKIEKT